MTELKRIISFLESAVKFEAKELSFNLVDYPDDANILLAALRAQAERDNPKPLTLDEFKQMDGKPVYIVTLEDADKNPPYWAIAAIKNEHGNRGVRLISHIDDDSGAYYLYGKTWLAYDFEVKQ